MLNVIQTDGQWERKTLVFGDWYSPTIGIPINQSVWLYMILWWNLNQIGCFLSRLRGVFFLVPKVPSNRSCCCALPPPLKCRTTFRAETCESTDIWIGQRQLVNILILTNQSKVPEGAQATSKKQLHWSQTARDFGGVGLFWCSRSLEMKDSRGLTLNMTGCAQMQGCF